MATSVEASEKTGPDQENSRKYLPFRKKIVKIGPVDTEINDKNCSLSIVLTAMDQKKEKSSRKMST